MDVLAPALFLIVSTGVIAAYLFKRRQVPIQSYSARAAAKNGFTLKKALVVSLVVLVLAMGFSLFMSGLATLNGTKHREKIAEHKLAIAQKAIEGKINTPIPAKPKMAFIATNEFGLAGVEYVTPLDIYTEIYSKPLTAYAHQAVSIVPSNMVQYVRVFRDGVELNTRYVQRRPHPTSVYSFLLKTNYPGGTNETISVAFGISKRK